MIKRIRLALPFAVVGLFAAAHATAAVGDQGTMDDACASPDTRLSKLCRAVDEKFKSPQDSYVHLGGDFFIVFVSNTGRVAQGIYVANVKTGQLNLFGGYGSPELGSVEGGKSGSIWIEVKQGSMSHGQSWETWSLLERRLNPVTKTPYLVRHVTRAKADLSEEMQSFCSRPGNDRSSKCSGLGETVYLNQEEIEHLKNGTVSTDRRQSERILAAHKEALRVYKNKIYEGKNPYQFLEDANVWLVLDTKPKTMSIGEYVNVLNDYAFLAYQYGEGRTDLAIEILDKVIRLSPGRTPAYLNMAEALEYLAKFGTTEYATIPLDDTTIAEVRTRAATYRDKYRSMRGQPRKDG